MKLLFIPIIFLLISLILAEEKTELKVETLAKSTSSWSGDSLPAYPEGQPEITILKIEIPAGMKLDWHQHPVINAGVMTKGELTVTTDSGETLDLKAGSAIIEVVDKWHFGENKGKESAEIIVFYAGVKGKDITVKK